MKQKTKARPYQKKGIRGIEKFNGRMILADEMGLGKTFQVLRWFMKKRKRDKHLGPAIVVCPASVKYTWEREIQKHTNLRCKVLEGRKPPKRLRFGIMHPITIINYDILGAWLPYLHSLAPEVVFLDEVQYIKNIESQRTRHTFDLCQDVPHIIGMSGTPLTNRPRELWPILSMLRPKVFDSFWSFGTRFCRPEKKRWGWTWDGADNLGQLNKLLRRTCMIRRLKKNVLKDLPAKTRTVIPLPITNRKEYLRATHNFMDWLGEKSKLRAIKAKKAQAMVKGGYLKRLAAELKLKAVYEWIDNFLDSTDEKLVVFGLHKPILRPLRERYHENSVIVDGRVKGRKRRRAIDQFVSDKDIRLFIGQIKATGVGVDGLQGAASNIAIIELPWAPADLTQVEDRLHRIGQSNAVNCYYLVAQDTIEERLCRIIQDKQDVLGAILDNTSEGGDLQVFDLLMEELLNASANKRAA